MDTSHAPTITHGRKVGTMTTDTRHGLEARATLRPSTAAPIPTDTLTWISNEPQVWHDSWRNTDRVCRFTGRCVTCARRTYMFDDGENDPRGILGDRAGSPLHAEDYDATGPDLAQCFLCANEEPTYRQALTLARGLWTDANGDPYRG